MADHYTERKLAGACTRCGEPAEDGFQLCAKHRADQKRYAAAAYKAARAKRRAARACMVCGGKRHKKSRWCLACLIKRGKITPKQGSKKDQKTSRDLITARTEQRMESDGWKRNRFHGQARTGPQSRAQLDDQDLDSAIRALQRAKQGLLIARAPEMAELPRIQREENVRAALSHAELAGRFLEEVLDRNRPGGARHARNLNE